MEQIIFDSSYLLRPATFFRRLFLRVRFLWAVYLFNHFNCSYPSLEVVYRFLCFMAAIHFFEVYRVVFICCTTCCHLLSLIVICCCHSPSFIFTRCHSLSLVVIRCHSLSFVVTRCTTRMSFYKRSSKTKCCFLGRTPVKFHAGWFFMANADHYRN